jgi:hypothetical protein
MDCLSSEDLKEEKTYFAVINTLYRIKVLSSRKCVVGCFEFPSVCCLTICWRHVRVDSRSAGN